MSLGEKTNLKRRLLVVITQSKIFEVGIKHRSLPSDPIIIEDEPTLSLHLPLLTRFVKKPDIKVPDTMMGNQTYLGLTSPGVGDYANDDQ